MTGTRAGLLLVDGHVHLHPGFSVAEFLRRAVANLEAAAGGAEAGTSWTGVLLFTESEGTDRFTQLASAGDLEEFRLEPTAEAASLFVRARFSSGRTSEDAVLLLVAGRQIAVEGRLEVLAVCTAERFPGGGSLAATLDRVRAAGAVPVLPWGFGKWWRRRGERVAEFVRGAAPGSLLLGDNGGRPRSAPEPPLFRLARSRGLPILAGSDPLPFPDQLRRVGSYGSILSGTELDPRRPSESLARALLALRSTPPVFGRRVTLRGFAWAQLRMQARRRR